MPTKILRLGLTECTLLIMYWLKYHENIENTETISNKNNLIKWLYTTSGYYDKTQPGNYFNVVHSKYDTDIYKKYMSLIFDFIKNSDIYQFAFHEFCVNKTYIDEFKKCVNAKKEEYISQQIIFDFIQNKKILIVSPFSKLIKSQIDSGNWKHIYSNAPTLINSYIYTFPYTFFNDGPHNNILETSEYIFNNIIETIKEDYDSVIISCGAYGCLMAKQFYEIGKNVCVVGGELQKYFGILNTRQKQLNERNNLEIKNIEYWIVNIPEEYKPHDYMKIENGCYW
jgi:hypothetical protein